jgi:hypothetical protein
MLASFLFFELKKLHILLEIKLISVASTQLAFITFSNQLRQDNFLDQNNNVLLYKA